MFVRGDSAIPADCVPDVPDFTASQGLSCEVIDNGTVIASEFRSTAGGDCTDSTATAAGCFVSCSVFVSAADHSLTTGDCVTLRLTFNGNCVCSGVTTVT